MSRYMLTLAYVGTRFGGWQIQCNIPTIQGEVERTLSLLLGKKTTAVGSGRTDGGVHAQGQVAHFDTEKPIIPSRFLYGLNALLPQDIRALSLKEMDQSFHACFSATGKLYHYTLFLRGTDDPFSRVFHWHIPYSLDLEKMKEASSFLVGRHDFSSFTNVSGKQYHSKVRTLFSIDFLAHENNLILAFKGEGFLYKMVRNLVGSLVDIGKGKHPPSYILELLLAKDRRLSGPAAPPQGLCLMKVYYEPIT